MFTSENFPDDRSRQPSDQLAVSPLLPPHITILPFHGNLTSLYRPLPGLGRERDGVRGSSGSALHSLFRTSQQRNASLERSAVLPWLVNLRLRVGPFTVGRSSIAFVNLRFCGKKDRSFPQARAGGPATPVGARGRPVYNVTRRMVEGHCFRADLPAGFAGFLAFPQRGCERGGVPLFAPVLVLRPGPGKRP